MSMVELPGGGCATESEALTALAAGVISRVRLSGSRRQEAKT